MDPNFLVSRSATFSHRHGDRWVELVRQDPHSPAATDEERRWATETIYVCRECEEAIRVSPPTDERRTP